MKLWQRAALLIALPLCLECGFFLAIKQAQHDVDNAYIAESKSRDTVVLTYKSLKLCFDALSDVLNYRLSQKENFKVRAINCIQKLSARREELKANGGNDINIEKLEAVMNAIVVSVQRLNEDFEQPGFSRIDSIKRITTLANLTLRISETVLIEQEIAHKKTVANLNTKRQQFDELATLAILISTAFACGLAYLFNKSTLKQLDVLMQNSSKLARGESLLPPLEGHDELARLDKQFRLMALSISELTERERAILKNSGEWIFAIDSKMKFSFVSDAVRNLLNMAPEDVLGKHAFNLLGEGTAKIEEAKSKGEDQIFEATIKNSDDETVELQISVHWSTQEQTYFCIAHDIAARKQLERLKQSFIAMVSHDLRTPISANILTLDLLRSDPSVGQLTERGVKLVERSVASNNRLMNMINDLLDLERLEVGQLNIEPELTTFNDLIEEALPSVDVVAKAKLVNISHDDSDALLLCESSRIVQVLVNLLGNAVKFSPKDTEINIRIEEDEEYSSIHVIDQGPGIGPDVLPYIFDRFRQGNDGAATIKQGFGLGLEISKKLVELHGGTISVSSDLGHGSTFTIKLPRYKPEA
ncbi:MAG: PAS domain-containing sensor histidine kinase [Leptolyngbya sp.]|nr:PAS domain-containing sensor histidine kinase [Candidatus Melainabacteria bacterium]